MNGEQIRKVAELLQRNEGCTMMELIAACNSTTPSRRIADLRDKGWDIRKVKVEGKNYNRFYGVPPAPGYVPQTVWQPVEPWPLNYACNR